MEIKIETGGLRLDKALSDLTELSRSLANEQIKSGQVLVNGQVKKAKYTVQEGDVFFQSLSDFKQIKTANPFDLPFIV